MMNRKIILLEELRSNFWASIAVYVLKYAHLSYTLYDNYCYGIIYFNNYMIIICSKTYDIYGFPCLKWYDIFDRTYWWLYNCWWHIDDD